MYVAKDLIHEMILAVFSPATIFYWIQTVEWHYIFILYLIIVLIHTFNLCLLITKVDLTEFISLHSFQVENIIIRVVVLFIFPHTHVFIEIKEYQFLVCVYIWKWIDDIAV